MFGIGVGGGSRRSSEEEAGGIGRRQHHALASACLVTGGVCVCVCVCVWCLLELIAKAISHDASSLR
jgi:hypothetical protein